MIQGIGCLVCADSVDARGAKGALELCSGLLGGVPWRLFSHLPEATDKVEPIKSKYEYSKFMVEDLPMALGAMGSHCLVVQRDGVVVNPGAWDPLFLEFDYVGAPWPDGEVGNGGFSLRSARFREACLELGSCLGAEDEFLCRANKGRLESMGMRFAPADVAARFSWERCRGRWSYNGAFGLHLDGPVWKFVDPVARAMVHPLAAAYLAKHRNW
jgi:hypothetical protein